MISASLYDTLTIECIGPVALVTLRRAQQLNAMNKYMQAEITSTFELLSDDPDVRVIVVTDDGRAFMAGADIKEYATQSGPEFDIFQEKAARMYAAIEGNSKPVIAAVNGFALGGGFEGPVLRHRHHFDACQGLSAGDQTRVGAGWRRYAAKFQKLGRNRANFLLMTGDIVPDSEFVSVGLVNEIVALDALLPHAMEMAAMIATEPGDTVEGLKRLTRIALVGDLADGLAQERALVCHLYRTEIA